MNIKEIRVLEYHYGDETRIKNILYKATEPVLIKIKNFPDQFNLDYFAKNIQATTQYKIYENNVCIDKKEGDFATIMGQIKNKPYKIFGQILKRQQSAKIECHVPLWQKIPFRPRFFSQILKATYFFGGKGAHTIMHFDREYCCNLHLCLSGKKEVLLFTEDQSENLYKLPYIGNSLIDFTLPPQEIKQHYPRINNAVGFKVLLETGDMLFMPKNCWHYTYYLEPSAAATYVFYPRKWLQFYGYFTGYFYIGYWDVFNMVHWPLFKKFNQSYATASGKKKLFLKGIELISFPFLLPMVSITYRIYLKIIGHNP